MHQTHRARGQVEGATGVSLPHHDERFSDTSNGGVGMVMKRGKGSEIFIIQDH